MKISIKNIEFLDDRNLVRKVEGVGGGISGKILIHDGAFEKIISLDNLFVAWQIYRKGKRRRPDVQKFEFHLEDNIFELHEELQVGRYHPGSYQQFRVTDPKPRIISKALVRDRLLHQAIYQILYPAFDQMFIFDSYSCRNYKGTHRAFKRVVASARKISRNYTAPCWALKMDIKKFFDSIDHEILLGLLAPRIDDERLMILLKMIIKSFSIIPGKGMPLGNLTSQIFANIYLNKLDQFIKHTLRVKYYIRYCDDFVMVGSDKQLLVGVVEQISAFLESRLKLSFHQDKIVIRKLRQGIDFVGYVALPHHRVLRTRTKRRMLRRVNEQNIASYRGLLQHCDGYKLMRRIDEDIFS